ncbi:PRC-barrel domain-containing protein [Kocuria sp. M4R2S49]|uniref:PRC-barrel domain-containing protein n=1 Tax=Kocuria rhizosphaericola TaxID=3376284 RepID=UPI0037B471A9
MLTRELERTIGHKAYSTHGHKIGEVIDVYLDDQTEEPEFVCVDTGLFGTKKSFVPVRGARINDDDELVVPYEKELVKNARKVDADQHLSPEEERELYHYYGLTFDVRPVSEGQPERARLRKHVVEDKARTEPVREERSGGLEPVPDDDVRIERVETDVDDRR